MRGKNDIEGIVHHGRTIAVNICIGYDNLVCWQGNRIRARDETSIGNRSFGMSIVDAIVEDDRTAVKQLLKTNCSLAHFQFDEATLFRGKLCHWIYAGDSVLHLAAAGYRVEIVRVLLKAGADPNTIGKFRNATPLHYATDSGAGLRTWNDAKQVETVRCLLEAGAKIDAQDKNGATPLHRAVRTRGAAAVRFLLEAGANPLVRNKPGSMPFHLAVQNTGRGGSGSDEAKLAQREIIREFLSRGVSLKLKDGKGKTVLQCAQSDWICEMLGV